MNNKESLLQQKAEAKQKAAQYENQVKLSQSSWTAVSQWTN